MLSVVPNGGAVRRIQDFIGDIARPGFEMNYLEGIAVVDSIGILLGEYRGVEGIKQFV